VGITFSEAGARTYVFAFASSGDQMNVEQIEAGDLSVGYVGAGPENGPAILLLHGWPYDIHAYDEVTPMLVEDGYRVIVPYLRGYGTTRFLSDETDRNGEQVAFALDAKALLDALEIERAIVAGFDWGSRTAAIMAALWPERCAGLVAVSGYLIGSVEINQKPLPPKAELGWWYQYYFSTERGRLGYSQNRHEFTKLIWQLASPKWDFDDPTFERTAASFDNPDHVDIVIHNYRWRLGLAEGDVRLLESERKLAERPTIGVPTLTIASDFDGPNADGKTYADRFTGPYEHRIFDGIGHNVPQEAPTRFAKALIDLADRETAQSRSRR
jgi:pimeloyl-ACP methyl ester carboxylesterase